MTDDQLWHLFNRIADDIERVNAQTAHDALPTVYDRVLEEPTLVPIVVGEEEGGVQTGVDLAVAPAAEERTLPQLRNHLGEVREPGGDGKLLVAGVDMVEVEGLVAAVVAADLALAAEEGDGLGSEGDTAGTGLEAIHGAEGSTRPV